MLYHSKDDDTSDEEREWLEAIESGEIEHYEKKKAEKNPTALTARQRRLKHGDEVNWPDRFWPLCDGVFLSASKTEN